jgi:hypothetical protein
MAKTAFVTVAFLNQATACNTPLPENLTAAQLAKKLRIGTKVTLPVHHWFPTAVARTAHILVIYVLKNSSNPS